MSLLKQMPGRDFRRRLEFGDGLLLVYLAAFVRQYLWPLDTWAAWSLTAPLALAAWYVYVSTKGDGPPPAGRDFWLVVALPLAFVYALRAPFPDTSFDVWGSRLFHAERALRGFLYLPGDFFPTSAPFNPAPDMVTGIFRHLLGYRLGTVVNLVALVWAGRVVERLLRPHVADARLRAGAVLLCLLAEHLLFEINNYMIDLLALPLLLEATRLLLEARGPAAAGRGLLARVAFLLGAAAALKLSNAAVAAPLALLAAWRALAARPTPARLAAGALASLLAFAAPLVPHALHSYELTGSPFFPVYSSLFESPFHPPTNGWDSRWGGLGPWEILGWPVLMFFEPERASELNVYTGRLTLAFVAALAALPFARRLGPRLRALSFLILLGSLLWSLTMGYLRYAFYLEALSGVLLVALAARLLRGGSRPRAAAGALVAAAMVAQSVVACVYVSRLEWGMRPTVFEEPGRYARELPHLLRDRTVRGLLPEAERETYAGVGVWVMSGAKTAGLLAVLNRRAPVVGVRTLQHFESAEARAHFRRVLDQHAGRRMWSLAYPSDFAEAAFHLRERGFEIGSIRPVSVPLFAEPDRLHLYLFEVFPPAGPTPAPAGKLRADGPLAAGAFRARVSLDDAPARASPGEFLRLFFRVTNAGGSVWPSLPRADGAYGLSLRARWLGPAGAVGRARAAAAPIPFDVPPGASAPVPLEMWAPEEPGEYVLEADMEQEGVAAFAARGSEPLRLKVQVGPK